MEKKPKPLSVADLRNTSCNEYQFRIKRVYDAPYVGDGLRILVDRLWPRGIGRKALALADWMKEVAPSPPLRKWFGHEAAKWGEFQQRYRAELDANASAWEHLLELVKQDNVTLLYAARDAELNHATVLKKFLNAKTKDNQKQKETQHVITIRR